MPGFTKCSPVPSTETSTDTITEWMKCERVRSRRQPAGWDIQTNTDVIMTLHRARTQ